MFRVFLKPLIQEILALLNHIDVSVPEIVLDLSTTMHKTKSWIVAIKGLQVFHRLIQEGNERFISTIVKLNPKKILDLTDWKGFFVFFTIQIHHPPQRHLLKHHLLENIQLTLRKELLFIKTQV